jgi:hypothetical protein
MKLASSRRRRTTYEVSKVRSKDGRSSLETSEKEESGSVSSRRSSKGSYIGGSKFGSEFLIQGQKNRKKIYGVTFSIILRQLNMSKQH